MKTKSNINKASVLSGYFSSLTLSDLQNNNTYEVKNTISSSNNVDEIRLIKFLEANVDYFLFEISKSKITQPIPSGIYCPASLWTQVGAHSSFFRVTQSTPGITPGVVNTQIECLSSSYLIFAFPLMMTINTDLMTGRLIQCITNVTDLDSVRGYLFYLNKGDIINVNSLDTLALQPVNFMDSNNIEIYSAAFINLSVNTNLLPYISGTGIFYTYQDERLDNTDSPLVVVNQYITKINEL